MKTELENLPAMASKMKKAKEQAREYGEALAQKYNAPRLKRFAVVSLGFDRLWCEEVERLVKL